jgi:hypothetical protein
MDFLFDDADGSFPNFLGSISNALKELALPKPEDDRVKRAIDRAARAAGIDYWRAFDLWYCKARRVDAQEALKIREALRLKRERDLQHEYQELRTRLAKLESRMVKDHSHFRR